MTQGIAPAIRRLQAGQLCTEHLPPAAVTSVLGAFASAGEIRSRLDQFVALFLQPDCTDPAQDAVKQACHP